MKTDYYNQAKDFLVETNVSFIIDFKCHDKYFGSDTEKRDIYYITLTSENHSFLFTFGQSIASKGQVPTAYDVLACLTKYEVETFKDFCSEFGYDEFGKNTEQYNKESFKIWGSVKNEYSNVEKLWNEKQLEKLREIS